ncbi:GntR family transcriptional regulator [Serpentinicella alkaliphila]|uniref:DNA-binding GntR family transcriptional regulator n=1 Tax=Serpentinicella alkaliphila TaxID=1734049 RepID=A0A4R2TQW5_9FIRM|nr:GntR family transcriptional regulator [Serpentinicella alkaliphila]QUH27132.1 GntR family transcriptional regulator [Serpentinicella alkaliphila]TCQ05266.1 DNA-binding GntR family transcriptional regulator [Serpentinicella alkaliphila]
MIETTKTQLPLKEKAYNLIKNKIVKCELAPGNPISEAELSNELGMSRTPVREALLRLSQEKFITIYPRKGIIVSPITVQDIHEVFQVREIVEPYFAKIGCRNMSKEYLIDLRKKFESANFDLGHPSGTEYFDLDIEFHKYIIKAGNNSHLIKFTNRIFELDYRIRVMSTLAIEDIVNRSRPEHFDIIEALINKDEKKIEETIKGHIANAREAALLKI